MNFTFSRDPYTYFRDPNTFTGKPLEQNKWFESLREQGYRIHVIQPEYLAFDHLQDSPADPLADSSLTFASESFHALIPLDLPAIGKSHYILDGYLGLSFFFSLVQDGFREFRNASFGRFLGLSTQAKGRRMLTVVSSMNVLPRLEEDLEHAGPGRAFFVHLLMPHYPYAYERDCGIRPLENGWLEALDRSLAPRWNDDASRGLRYPSVP